MVSRGRSLAISGHWGNSNTVDCRHFTFWRKPNATENTVTLSGGTTGGNIYGGYIDSGSGDATKNIVTLSGTPDLTASNIYGGYSTGSGDVFTGNTLNVHTGGHTVKSVQNFEFMNFFVPTTMGNAGTMITATDSANIDNAIVNVGIEGSSSPLKAGDHIVLIDVLTGGGLIGNPFNDTSSGTGMLGVTLLYNFDILIPESNTDQLWAVLKIGSIDPAIGQVNPQAKALSEGYLAGSMLLNQSGDRLANNVLNSAVNAAWQNRNCGWGIFADISGGWSQYNTGSHVDLNSTSVIAGVSRCAETVPGRLTGGLFVEYGNGSYDAFNTFYNAASVHSKGKLDHIGGGVLGRFEFANFGYGLNRFYLDGSFRVGNIHNKFDSDLRDLRGTAARYNSDSTYYGAHIGGGKIWHFANGFV